MKRIILSVAVMFFLALSFGCGDQGPTIDASSATSLEQSWEKLDEYAVKEDKEDEFRDAAMAITMDLGSAGAHADGMSAAEVERKMMETIDGMNMYELIELVEYRDDGEDRQWWE